MADWIGIVAGNHADIVLNNKTFLNPNRELFEPYITYQIPIKETICDASLNAYKVKYTKRDFWSLKWPVQQGYERIETEKFIIASPSNRTEYGGIVSNDILANIIDTGANHSEESIARKWKNTKDFFDYVNGKP